MSIFQSSFPPYIIKQLKIRDSIIQQGNEPGTSNSRFGRPKAEFIIGDQKHKIPIAAGAFYTNTVERQCTIRMSSGVDISGSNDMAQRFVLEGGTPKEERGQREGFMHGSRKGNSYGDKRIFADAGDGFGIVPMPGIIDANVRTKSAYGSLREAKVNFVCHNRRQLETLERLYMRPGFPILLEWGWTPYISNEGDIETSFPHLSNFFTAEYKINDLQKDINERKKETGGNYDGFLGICKNFEFKATPAGGYECSTDIIAMGEVLSGLKGKRSGNTILIENEETEVDNLEFFLHSIKQFSSEAFTRDEKLGKKTVENYDTSAAIFRTFQELAKTIDPDRVQLFEAIDEEGAMTSLQIKYRLHKELDFDNNKMTKTRRYKSKEKQEAFENYVDEMDDIEALLDKFIINKGEKVSGIVSKETGTSLEKGSPYTYIRWDFFCHLMNTHILEEYQPKENISELAWHDNKNSYYNYVRTVTNPEVMIPLDQNDEGESTTSFSLKEVLDISLNPSKFLLPHQIAFVETVGKVWNDNILIKDSDGSNIGLATKNSIGLTFLSVEYLLEKYKSMRYNSDGDLNGDFEILNFIKEVWEKDANNVCAGSHNFMVHHDKEDTTKVRIIDLIFQSNLKKEDLYEFNIQDNKSIVRDFNFNTTIPSALSSTMAVVAQNPDSISDLEGVTISSMNKDLTSRFSKPLTFGVDDEIIKNKRITDEIKLIELASKLKLLNDKVKRGEYNETIAGTEDENETKPKTISISKAMSTYKSLIDLIESLLVRYPLSTEDTKDKFEIDGINRAGYRRKKFKPSKSSIIPLKFTCKMDGIGGIVIGNVFRINKNRLPIGYQGDDIAFMTHAESQTITSGQDWTTEISGQLLLLDLEQDAAEYTGIIISPGDFAIKEIPIKTDDATPNADKLRQVIEVIGYTEKGGKKGLRGKKASAQIAQNGDIDEDMFLLAASVLIHIKKQLGDKVKIEVTGGNDNYHAKSDTSRHKFGRAIDFVIRDPRPTKKDPTKDGYDKNLYRIETILRSFAGAKSAGGSVRFINEYAYPSAHANGDHFHLSWGQGSEAGPSGWPRKSDGTPRNAQNVTGDGSVEGSMDNLTYSTKLIAGEIKDEVGNDDYKEMNIMSESAIETTLQYMANSATNSKTKRLLKGFKFEEPQK